MKRSSINLDHWINRLLIFRMLENIYFTVFYILLIPLIRIFFDFISKKIKSKRNMEIPLSTFFYKFFRFYAYYLFPIMVFVLIINKWIN